MSEALQSEARLAPVRVGTARAADGAELRWRVDGAGTGVPLLCANGIGVSSFFWHFIAEQFGGERPVITWDYRGHGASPVPAHPEELTVAGCASDLWTVADAVGARHAVLLGHSMGCQVGLEAIRQAPSRALGFVPMLGAPGRIFESFPISARLLPLVRAALAFTSSRTGLAEQVLRRSLQTPGLWPLVRAMGLVHPDLCPREEFEPYFAHLAGLDLRCYFALFRDLLTHDATDFLPSLHLPTLVIAGSRDLFTPMFRSEEMAKAIPHAELLVVRDGSHAALVEQPELIQLALERFLRKHHLGHRTDLGG